MPSTRVGELAVGDVVNTIPGGKILVPLLRHLEAAVQGGEHLAGLEEVGFRQRLRADRVEDRDREQRRADAVAHHVDQVKGEVIFIGHVIAEGVASETRRRG